MGEKLSLSTLFPQLEQELALPQSFILLRVFYEGFQVFLYLFPHCFLSRNGDLQLSGKALHPIGHQPLTTGWLWTFGFSH